MAKSREAVYNELLALRCKRGDREAMRELVRVWERRLFYYIRRIVPGEQDAWDVLQETWVRVIGGISSLRRPASLPAWLYRTARNTAISHLRAMRSDVSFEDCAETLGDIPVDEEEPFGPEDAARVHRALDAISLPHREVLTLHFLQDLSIEEIAGVVGVPAGTVKSRIHYAKRALRTALEQEEPSE